MIKFGSKKDEQTVGLDIGTHSVKVVALQKGLARGVLKAYNIKKIPGDMSPSDPGFKDIIKEAFDEISLKPSAVNLGFSGSNVIVRFIDMPKMTKEQLENALNFEADKYIPFSVNEVFMDFLILGDSSEPMKMRVLLAAAKRDLVQNRLKLMSELGITINVMDIDCIAAFNAFAASQPTDHECAVFFHFGHSHTHMLIAIGEIPCFARQIQIGVKDILDNISKELNIPFEEAEAALCRPDSGTNAVEEKISFAVMDDIIREFQLSFGYFENRYNTPVNSVYCSGGIIHNRKKILDYLAEKTGFAIKTWDPLNNFDIQNTISREDINAVSSQLSVSVGLALRN